MEHKEYLRVVTLQDLWELLVRRIMIIVLAAVVAVGGTFMVRQMTYEPLYESTATLYILRQSDEVSSSGDASNDFSLALKVVNDCTYLLKSHTVLDAVILDLGLDMSYSELYHAVSTSNPENTRILEVMVQAKSPELAKQIVDRICELGKVEIAKAMGFEQVNLFEYGVLNRTPCNRTSIINYALVGILTGVLTYGVFLVIYLLDDTIRTNENIEQYLGLSVLGEIPDAKDIGKSRKGYYYSYGSKPKTTRKGK